MGIKDLYPVIKEVAPGQIRTYHLSELTGLRFAIDISVFLYKYIRTAGPDGWMNIFVLFLCTLKKHGIKAVCIFDGPNPPVEKKKEQERRRGDTQKIVNRLEECKRIREKLREKYIPFDDELSPRMLRECKALIGGKRKNHVDTTNYNDAADVVDSLSEVIERLQKQTYPIKPEHSQIALEIVRMMGLYGCQAEGEAETLCAYLAIKGEVDAVLTEDTDVLAYGTPLFLAFKEYKLSDEKLVAIHLPELEEEMEMDHDEFRDLCILLSCDYNSRVKGYPPDGRTRKKPISIGWKGALCMIQEYRRLEEVCKHVEDDKPLKYRRCRELFTIPDSIPEGVVPYNKPPDYLRLEEFIEKNNLTVKIDYIAKCYKPPEFEFLSSDEETESSSGDEFDLLGDSSE